MIEIRDVAKQFVSRRGVTDALSHMSLRIEAGALACLVGPSGCGKTTLLNLIAGLERADAGEVLVDGVPVTGPGPDRSVLFQESALFPWLTIQKNVEFALKMLGVSRRQRRERASHWLDVVGMSAFADANVHELSGGMRQRAALARALALEPRILLMDEPFAALDVHTRAAMHEEIERVWLDTKKTIVFITHDLAEAVRLGTRVTVLERRPARVRCHVDVTLPRPRSLDDPALLAIARELRAGIRPTTTPAAARDEEQEATHEEGADDGTYASGRLPGRGAPLLGAPH